MRDPCASPSPNSRRVQQDVESAVEREVRVKAKEEEAAEGTATEREMMNEEATEVGVTEEGDRRKCWRRWGSLEVSTVAVTAAKVGKAKAETKREMTGKATTVGRRYGGGRESGVESWWRSRWVEEGDGAEVLGVLS